MNIVDSLVIKKWHMLTMKANKQTLDTMEKHKGVTLFNIQRQPL